MENFIIEILNNYGYWGFCFLIMLENVFPPIPSELILTFGGFITISTNLTLGGVIIASTIGSVIGANILYYFGRIFNKEKLIGITQHKYGKLLRIKSEDIEKVDSWFDKKGHITVFFCRFIPVVRSLISIPAGMSEMPLKRFNIYTLFGSLIWNSALISIGAFAGDKKEFILNIIDKSSYMLLILFFVIGILLFLKKYKKYNSESIRIVEK